MAAQIEELWAEFGDPLKRFIAKRVGSEHDAEDLLQEVFLRAHVAVHGVRDPDRVRPWLYRIATNAVADHHRQRRPVAAPIEADELAEDPPDPDNANGEVLPCVGLLIDGLPDGYRRALVLADLEDRPQKDVAAELGLSLPGAKSRVQRARRKLRATLTSCCDFDVDHFGNILDWQTKGDACRYC